jgi:xylose isomerase
VKSALDMGARFHVPISVLWPATDGNDFHLQSNYIGLYDRYVDSVRKILEYLHQNDYATKICIEPKPFEPRSYIMMANTSSALCVINEIDDPGLGINLDVGHSLIAKENLEEQISLVCRYGRLYHTHWNDNDQQCDADLPPGATNFNRLVAAIYVLNEAGYDGWFGLDLFPYRDDYKMFMEQSRDNLRLARRVVDLMNEKGSRELRRVGNKGMDLTYLMLDCMQEAGAPQPA